MLVNIVDFKEALGRVERFFPKGKVSNNWYKFVYIQHWEGFRSFEIAVMGNDYLYIARCCVDADAPTLLAVMSPHAVAVLPPYLKFKQSLGEEEIHITTNGKSLTFGEIVIPINESALTEFQWAVLSMQRDGKWVYDYSGHDWVGEMPNHVATALAKARPGSCICAEVSHFGGGTAKLEFENYDKLFFLRKGVA